MGAHETNIARLAGARLITCTEIARGARLNEALFNDVTGGGMLSRFARSMSPRYSRPSGVSTWVSTTAETCSPSAAVQAARNSRAGMPSFSARYSVRCASLLSASTTGSIAASLVRASLSLR